MNEPSIFAGVRRVASLGVADITRNIDVSTLREGVELSSA